MSNWIIPLVLLVTIALLGAAFIGHIADFNTHDHPGSIQDGDKVCIEGGGFFPHGMPGPMPFLVCGVIDHFNPNELETVEPPASYPEGTHHLEGVDSTT